MPSRSMSIRPSSSSCPARVATIVVGNPLIADVTLQAGGILVVTGKGYGATNFIAMDRAGEVLVDRLIQVEGPTDQLVTVYRGVDRESYSCMPICQRRVTLGDGDSYFKATMDRPGNLSGQASGSAGSQTTRGRRGRRSKAPLAADKRKAARRAAFLLVRKPDLHEAKSRRQIICRRDFQRGPASAGCAQIVGRRLAGTAIGDDLVADLLAFTQRSKAGAFDGADVHEHVVATVIRLDEAVALGRVKPLHGSHAHGIVPSQDRYNEAHFRRLVRSNFWKGRQRLNRLYRWIANVVRPKIDKVILFQSSAPKQS